MESLAAVILAAGKGTRMKSRIPKVLHPLAGRPMIYYPVQLARALGAEPIAVIVGPDGKRVQEALEGSDLRFIVQEPQLGTGHAVGFAREVLKDHPGEILILCGDVPLLEEDTLRKLVAHHRGQGVRLTALVGRLEDPTGYGRILRGGQGSVLRVVEERDATDEVRAIGEVNAGIYCAEPKALFQALDAIRRENAQGEYYLTDLVEILAPEGVATLEVESNEEFLGINDRLELVEAEEILQWRRRKHWMREGVTMQDPGTAYLDADVQIDPDTVLGPQIILRGMTRVGAGCRIGVGCVIEDSILEDGSTVHPYSVILASHVGPGASIGPFAHLRPGSDIGAGARIGNFVEVKKAKVGPGSKASHLSYLGDAEIGEGVNIGAGTITCNYDGFTKHRTVIEDDVFVGSDTQFVAPVRVGRGAVVGAGSTITKNVPPGSLAVSRARQMVLRGKARRRIRKG